MTRNRWWSHGALQALEHRDFRRFWIAALISNSGGWMQQITVPFVLFAITESNTWLGVAGFAGLLPAFVMSPIAGVLADRIDRRKILLVTLSVQMSVALALWGMWVSDQLSPLRMVCALAVHGTANGIQVSAWQSLVPLLVPRSSLVHAVQLNSTQFTAARAFGPAVAGGALAAFGPAATFMANAISFLVVIGTLGFLNPRVAASTPGRHPIRQIREGFGTVARHPALRLAVICGTSISVFGMSLTFLAAGFAAEVFEVGETGLGTLTAAVGVGSICAAILVVFRGVAIPRSTLTLFGIAAYGVSGLVLGATASFPVGVAGFFVAGVSHVSVSVSVNAAIQLQVPDEIRGRVISVYLMGILGGVPSGALIAGRLADTIGLRPTATIFGGLLVGVAALVSVSMDRGRALDHDHIDELALAAMS